MKRTIRLVDSLLARAQNLHQLGIHTPAHDTLHQLAKFRDLPTEIKKATHLKLAQIDDRYHNYKNSRRHLSLALTEHESESQMHYRLGKAYLKDKTVSEDTAGYHLKKAVKCEPNNVDYLSALAVYGLKSDQPRLALKAIRKAYGMQTDNARVVKTYFRVLQTLGRVKEGKAVLTELRFRLARMRWFRKVQAEFKFFVTQRRQAKTARCQQQPQEDICLLPFPTFVPRLIVEEKDSFIRRDSASVLPKPHLAGRKRRPDQRHAQ